MLSLFIYFCFLFFVFLVWKIFQFSMRVKTFYIVCTYIYITRYVCYVVYEMLFVGIYMHVGMYVCKYLLVEPTE